MKVKGGKKHKVNVITLGCSKNIVDSEVLLSQLNGNGISVLHNANSEIPVDTVVINTCGFIESAKQESIDTILQYINTKKNGMIKKVFVTGCLSERYKKELNEEIKEVDGWFGTQDLIPLLNSLNADFKKDLIGERAIPKNTHFSYLKISEGCDRPCSFCAIPLMRGKHISKPMEEIMLEVKKLAQKGVKELMIIGQDTTYYGLDLYKKRNLAELLSLLSQIDGIEWIRLHYAFPSGFPEDILDVIRDKKNICNYLDIPLQHASSNVLKNMKRGIDRSKTQFLVDKIRNKIPNIALRTTMMVGYPNETKEDFEILKEFIIKNKFERLGVFIYSHEENTAAYSQKDNILERDKKERANELMSIQEKISTDINLKKIGQILKVIVDKKEGSYYVGRTEYDSPEIDNEVLIPAYENHIELGDFVNVKITDASAFDLFGDIV